MKGELIIIADDKLGGIVNRVEYTKPVELEDLQSRVGGFLEVVPGFNRFEGKPCAVFCNEEGKLEGLPRNSNATRLWAEANKMLQDDLGDALVGPVVIVTGDKEFMEAL